MTESELRRRYPAAFNDERKPLKVGIEPRHAAACAASGTASLGKRPDLYRESA
jgi:hypothetical protein